MFSSSFEYSCEEEEEEEKENNCHHHHRPSLQLEFFLDIETEERFYHTILKFLNQLSTISLYINNVYIKYVLSYSHELNENEDEDDDDEKQYMDELYWYLIKYVCSHKNENRFSSIIKCQLKNEDIERKTSMQIHLFWEICRLFVCIQYANNNPIENYALPSSILHSYGMIIDSGDKSPLRYSQRELNKAFFLLSAKWKTIDYSQELYDYIQLLLYRSCLFFCCPMSKEEMDDEYLRQPIPVDPSLESKYCYAPNLDFVIMCQIRFLNYSIDLFWTQHVQKVNLQSNFFSFSTSQPQHQEEEEMKEPIELVTLPSHAWLSVDILKHFCMQACELISPEQKERTSSRFIYCCFSESDRDWLLYKKPISLASFADEFIARECKDTGYSDITKLAARSLKDIIKDEKTNLTMVGFYEWCILKNLSRLFAAHFDLFETNIYNREDVILIENSVSIFHRKKPLIVQFFSRYHVFYQRKMYVIENHTSDEMIYYTLLCWICIMIRDFPESKKTKHIVSVLKSKFTELNSDQQKIKLKTTDGGVKKRNTSSSTNNNEPIPSFTTVAPNTSKDAYFIQKHSSFYNSTETTGTKNKSQQQQQTLFFF